MTDKSDNQPIAKPVSPAYSIATTSGATFLCMKCLPLFFSAEQAKELEFIAPFVGGALALTTQYFYAFFIAFTPNEIRQINKLKKDKKRYVELIKEANENPELFPNDYLEKLKDVHAQTVLMLASLGQK